MKSGAITQEKREEKIMKICHMEAMKEIKALEDEKNRILEREDDTNTVSYKEDEPKVTNGYSYTETRKRV